MSRALGPAARAWPRAAAALGLAAALGVAAATPPGAAAQGGGDPARGEALFTAKQCARCHRPGAQGIGPPLEALRRPQGAYELAGRMWNHAPGMFTVLVQEQIPWPTIAQPEMTDLMAYLHADEGRDPRVDPARGRVLLVAKGCLKCHAWRGEGARVGPELSQRRENLAPASRWAATLWGHAPRMAQVAIAREVLYPRFSGDEMAQLIGFLRAGNP